MYGTVSLVPCISSLSFTTALTTNCGAFQFQNLRFTYNVPFAFVYQLFVAYWKWHFSTVIYSNISCKCLHSKFKPF
jgi:hypothetical protein